MGRKRPSNGGDVRWREQVGAWQVFRHGSFLMQAAFSPCRHVAPEWVMFGPSDANEKLPSRQGTTMIARFAACATALLIASGGCAFAKDWTTVTIALEGAYEPWNSTKPDGS